jgi:hypothetical protein
MSSKYVYGQEPVSICGQELKIRMRSLSLPYRER